MSSSIHRTLSILRRGVETVHLALGSSEYSGVGYDRVARLVDASRQITWAHEENGQIYAAEDGALTDVQVAVIAGPLPSGLDSNSTFQTQEDGDGATRVYVQRHPYTPTWAGIVLFHELDHVLDHLDGAWPPVPTAEDWWDAEARPTIAKRW